MKNQWIWPALMVAGLVGCGGDEETPQPNVDMGVAADSAVVEADSAIEEDAAAPADATAATDGGSREDAAVPADAAALADAALADAAVTAATWGDVHTEFRSSCTPCHSTGSSGGFQVAQTNAADAYDDSQLSATSGACAGLTKGACSAVRVRNGSMPPGGLSASERTRVADIVDSWVAGGQLAP